MKNLIGISGKSGSGKDLVASIIQYLVLKYTLNKSNLELVGKIDHFEIFNKWSPKEKESYSGFQVKRFAYKLKQVVSILTGIPVEDLEKEEVKNSTLPKEWNSMWEVHHNTGAAFNVTNYIKEESDNGSVRFEKHTMTVRQLLQIVGTDAMRDQVHPQVWVNALFADYKGRWEEQEIYPGSPMSPTKYVEGDKPKWIIPDVRFPNEFEAIKSRGGLLIRIERDYDKNDPKFSHASETALDDYFMKFDYVPYNRGTIEDLVIAIKDILTQEGII